MNQSILAILCERFSSFNPKGFYYSYAWSCSLWEGRTSFCTRLFFRKLYRFLLMFFTGFTSFSILLLFPLSITFFVLCTVFNSILSVNVFVFGHFNIHHKDWLTYSDGTDRPGELCYNLSISNDLMQMVNFPTRIPH